MMVFTPPPHYLKFCSSQNLLLEVTLHLFQHLPNPSPLHLAPRNPLCHTQIQLCGHGQHRCAAAASGIQLREVLGGHGSPGLVGRVCTEVVEIRIDGETFRLLLRRVLLLLLLRRNRWRRARFRAGGGSRRLRGIGGIVTIRGCDEYE